MSHLYLTLNEDILEYHTWRKMEPTPIEERGHVENKYKMTCDLCKEVTKRKNAGWAKRMIKSVASWWWLDVHDDR